MHTHILVSSQCKSNHVYILIGLRCGETHCVQWDISSDLQHRGKRNWRDLFMVSLEWNMLIITFIDSAVWHGWAWCSQYKLYASYFNDYHTTITYRPWSHVLLANIENIERLLYHTVNSTDKKVNKLLNCLSFLSLIQNWLKLCHDFLLTPFLSCVNC